MKTKLLLVAALAAPLALSAANNQILGWNNLGMHCMDSDYSVFSILPPYNTINAQLIVGGKLVTNGSGYSVTYRAVADPDGSINQTSAGKGNWMDYAAKLYGSVAVDQGLPFPGPDSFWMPGTNNTPQGMLFDPGPDWFYAYGIPITPYDDAGNKNPYPMMRLIARNAGGTAIATNDIVLPVSDEMDCRACHASGGRDRAKPAAGWVWSDNPERDFRLNILRLHDQLQFSNHNALYVSALAARGFNPQGLYRGVVADGKPVLCAVCHASEALGTGSYSNIPPLTTAIHSQHARVRDPDTQISLDNSANRAACYRCHPGSTTRCLRGAMGGAVAGDGSMEMQCQSCHGNMSKVGSPARTGWLNEPTCQQCHTGTATSNNGQIRYTSCFTDTNFTERVAVNQTFATKSNTPAPGLSLYRFSAGHGGLQCSACHGSTHAEFPATHRNDNLRNERIQGHAGVTVECTTCHSSRPNTITGGPHGLHPLDNTWAQNHGGLFEGNPPQATRQQCQVCHGTDYKGTVLSRAQTTRALNTEKGSPTFWRGQLVTCYECHNGPNSSDPTTHPRAVAQNASTNTTSDAPVSLTLRATGSGTITYRVISQPAHGSVGVSNNLATYFPDPGFVGADQFTFAANNGWVDSNLASGTVSVAQGPFSISAAARVPPSYPAEWPAPFGVTATPVSVAGAVTYDWDFGDGSAHGAAAHVTHTFAQAGSYLWRVIARVQSGLNQATSTNSGTITITAPAEPVASVGPGGLTLTWPASSGDVLIEEAPTLGLEAQWTVSPVVPSLRGGQLEAILPANAAAKFYRLRRL